MHGAVCPQPYRRRVALRGRPGLALQTGKADMANTVKNAKTAARKLLAAVVNGVKKGKPKDTADVSDVPKKKGKKTYPYDTVAVKDGVAKVTPGTDAAPKGKKDKPKDTAAVPAVSKKKGKKKTEDLSEAREDVTVKGKNAKHVSDVSTAKNVLGRGAARAKVFGYAASAVWRAVGFRQKKDGSFCYTVSQCKAMRDGLGLNGVIRDGNVKCQFADGRGRANGNDPLYGGDVPALTGDQWATLERVGGLK